MAVDDLVTQGARTSAAMLLTQFSWDILTSVPEGLTHLPLVPHINRVSISSDNGLLPMQGQAITWINAGLLSIGLLGTYFSEIWIRILWLSFKKMQLKMLSANMADILSRGRWVNPKLEDTSPQDHSTKIPADSHSDLITGWGGRNIYHHH